MSRDVIEQFQVVNVHTSINSSRGQFYQFTPATQDGIRFGQLGAAVRGLPVEKVYMKTNILWILAPTT
jgi:hypothetical protein